MPSSPAAAPLMQAAEKDARGPDAAGEAAPPVPRHALPRPHRENGRWPVADHPMCGHAATRRSVLAQSSRPCSGGMRYVRASASSTSSRYRRSSAVKKRRSWTSMRALIPVSLSMIAQPTTTAIAARTVYRYHDAMTTQETADGNPDLIASSAPLSPTRAGGYRSRATWRSRSRTPCLAITRAVAARPGGRARTF